MNIEDLKKRHEIYMEAWEHQLRLVSESVKFARLGEQWPEDVKAERENDFRPCLTMNKMPAYIRQVVNDARQNTPQIHVHPVDSKADPKTAEVMNGMIKSIEATSDGDQAYDTAIDQAASGGWSFIRVDVDFADSMSFDKELKIVRIINPNTCLPDPWSVEADGKDMKGFFITEKMPRSEFEKDWPNANKLSSVEGDYDDTWLDKDEVRIAQHWEVLEQEDKLLMLGDGSTILGSVFNKQLAEAESDEETLALNMIRDAVTEERDTTTQKVIKYIFNGEEILEQDDDYPGRYIPVAPVYGEEVVSEGKKYYFPMWYHARDAQVMFNFWRSAEAEEVAYTPKAPFVGPAGAFDTDADKWATANSKPHPYLQYDGDAPPQRQPLSQLPVGSVNAAQNVDADMRNIIGVESEGLGQASNAVSGVAIDSRRGESDTSTFHFTDNLTRGINQLGRIIVDLFPHTYNKPQVVRTMGESGDVDSVTINQEDNGQLFSMTTGKYDLVVKAGPSFATQRKEAMTNMMDLVKYDRELGKLIGDLVAKNMDWPGADEIAKRLKLMLPPEVIEMEKLDGLDENAQAIVMNYKQQVKQLSGILEQGKQALGAKDAEIQALMKQLMDRTRELDIKESDSQRKHKADQDDTMMDGLIAIMKENGDQQMAVLQNELTQMRDMFGEARDIERNITYEQ